MGAGAEANGKSQEKPSPTSEEIAMEAVDLDDNNKDTKDDKKGKNKKKEKPEGPPPVPVLQLFRYASGTDTILILLGVLAAAGTGVCMPLMMVLFGDMTNAFVYGGFDPEVVEKCNITFEIPPGSNITLPPGFPFNSTETSFSGEIEKFAIGTAVIGAILFALGYIFVTCLNSAAENQVHRLRGLFLQSILRQDISWYDVRATNDFASRITEDLNKIQEGMGEKIGMFLFCFTGFIASLINAFVHGWELTLVMMAAMPVLAVAMGFLSKVQASLTENELKAYGKAGSVAEEVLSAIRAVMAFGGQAKEVARFQFNLESARQAGTKRGLATGVGLGLTFGIIYASYSLAFWYGVKLILDGGVSGMYDPASLVIVFFSVLMASMNIGQASPYVEAFSVARGAAASIYEIIDRVPSIDSSSPDGKKLTQVKGSIAFEKVRFNYPTRPDVKILQGLSFSVTPGQTVALVGASGCGKSTCVQLIQRFYDPLEGSVKIDGEDIRDLNLAWLREQMGVVGQEPALFGTTIAENIRYGRDNVSQKEIEEAAKQANAHDFIVKLPKKYDTMVGERGAKLSGGQKQRIAIARALVRNPKILLLDEATSALDTQSESIVQKALDRARLGRTTVIVAHRLSTIRNADRIMVLLDGELKEEGTHRQLMSRRGVYFQLVTAQAGEDDNAPSSNSSPEESDTESAEDAVMKKGKAWIEEEDELSLSGALVQSNPLALSRTSSLRHSSRKVSYVEDIVETESATKEEEEETAKNVSIFKILKMNATEWPYIATGVLGAAIVGLSTPAYAVLFGEILGSLAGLSSEEIRSQSEFYAVLFLITGIAAGLASFFQSYMFAVAGEYLTSRIRVLSFQAILRQEIGWFDREYNSVGALCARLSGDASSVQGATGSRIGLVCQAVTTMCVSIALALYYEWKLGLVTMVFIPLVLLSTFFQAKIIMGQNAMERKGLEKSAKIAMEAISNIRTVASLGREKTFYSLYMELLHKPHVEAQKRTHIRGLVFGFAQSIPMFAYSVCMFYGGYLVANECLPFENVFKVSEALIFGTAMVGQAVAFAPNYNKAKVAANRVFQLLERKPLIDSSSTEGTKLQKVTGFVEYKDVKFRYPTRPDVTVLQDLDIDVRPGQTIALVGRSGCGKSTCVQLLERFYDPDEGRVNLDGSDTTKLNIGALRSHLGIVSQEPVLFNRTIGDNIAYGDNTRTVSMEEIIEAAKKANIHNFISSLPLGYDTMVGERGTQLSGGQKQRVAIARALVRNPKILLLDEATSALDSESEKVVQEALDKAREGRTCITIAHRLSTIQNADKIVVIQNGKVQEQGTHQELLERRGAYYELCALQGNLVTNSNNEKVTTTAL